jgi:hypothetical protein
MEKAYKLYMIQSFDEEEKHYQSVWISGIEQANWCDSFDRTPFLRII